LGNNGKEILKALIFDVIINVHPLIDAGISITTGTWSAYTDQARELENARRIAEFLTASNNNLNQFLEVQNITQFHEEMFLDTLIVTVKDYNGCRYSARANPYPIPESNDYLHLHRYATSKSYIALMVLNEIAYEYNQSPPIEWEEFRKNPMIAFFMFNMIMNPVSSINPRQQGGANLGDFIQRRDERLNQINETEHISPIPNTLDYKQTLYTE